jgi:hypothetical protein
MTNIWLPLIPNPNATIGRAPGAIGPGSPLALASCDASDPSQIFAVNPPSASSSAVHVASGLCVSDAGGAGASLTLAPCSTGDADSQTWTPAAGGLLTNGLPTSSSSCLDANNANNVLPAGNPVIAYACGNPTPAWNERWTLPPTGTASGGVWQALDASGKPSGMCVAAGSAPPPQPWSLPWLDVWSLGDY